MSLKITLVNPPYPKAAHQHPPFIPLGLGYLGAVCEKAGYDVNVIDCQAEFLEFSEFEDMLKKKSVDVIGVTSTTLTYNSALRIARIAKKVIPNCTIVLGGCHVTFWDENALEECSSLDVIVRGEGEETFLELVQKLEKKGSLKTIKGITFRDSEGKKVRNEDRPFIDNLDELPFPSHYL